jgi:hypothetical protein
MPRLAMPPTVPEALDKNIREQYEALGRFVVAFESMVEQTREVSIVVLKRSYEHSRRVEVVFHNAALTAKPLFEIMRALVSEYLKQPTTIVSNKDRDAFSGILAEIAAHYFDLVNYRNNLLHGTWYVGYVSADDPNADNFILKKLKTTKSGLTREQDLPKQASELLQLRDKCDKVANWISFVGGCLPTEENAFSISETFRYAGGRWQLTFRSAPPETLP